MGFWVRKGKGLRETWAWTPCRRTAGCLRLRASSLISPSTALQLLPPASACKHTNLHSNPPAAGQSRTAACRAALHASSTTTTTHTGAGCVRAASGPGLGSGVTAGGGAGRGRRRQPRTSCDRQLLGGAAVGGGEWLYGLYGLRAAGCRGLGVGVLHQREFGSGAGGRPHRASSASLHAIAEPKPAHSAPSPPCAPMPTYTCRYTHAHAHTFWRTFGSFSNTRTHPPRRPSGAASSWRP